MRPIVAQDHIVLLLGKEEFENPPQWLTDNFNIVEGGTHTGGSSRNKLIIFSDGSYVELFNWVKTPVEFPDWVDKKPGLIDFALTTLPPSTAQENYLAVFQALESGADGGLGASYDHPRSGGRKRKDGVEVQWEITRGLFHDGPNIPDASLFPSKRLDIPFFCHDLTERSVRVPSEDDRLTVHPCGAVGVFEIQVLVPRSHLQHYLAFYRSVLGVDEEWKEGDDNEQYATFAITAPASGGRESYISIYGAQSDASHLNEVSSQPDQGSDRSWLLERGIGIRGLTLVTGSSHISLGSTVSLAQDGIGSTVHLRR